MNTIKEPGKAKKSSGEDSGIPSISQGGTPIDTSTY